MKKKLNLSGAGLKQLGLAHGEKAVFALGAALLCGFVYAFFGRVTLPPSSAPEQLLQRVAQAQDNMKRAVWDPQREQLSVTDYVKRARWQPLASESYLLRTPFNLPIFQLKHKRPDPQLLAVESLQVSGGVGAFDLKSGLKGQHWVMLTGLTPVRKQFAAYEEAFKDTVPIASDQKRDESRDLPTYTSLVIERTEVLDDKDANLAWRPIDMVSLVRLMEDWSASSSEVVSLDYIDPVYTMPLGPLSSGRWDEKAAHLPEIPLATETERGAQEVLAAEEAKAHEERIKAGAEGGFGKMPGRNAKNAPKQQVNNPMPQVAGAPKKRIVDYRLFRFTDYTVEASKRYRYRVRLVLDNPNYGLADKLLKRIDSKLEQEVATPWSEPSPVVEMPRSEGMLVGTPKVDKHFGQVNPEPSATLLVFTVEPETGLEAAAERQVYRGSVLNFHSQISLYNPTTKKSEDRDVAFNTGALVLDISGGREMKSLSREKPLEPSEVLLLDGSSRLVAHSELDEIDLYQQHQPNAASSEESGATPTPRTPRNGLDAPARSPKKGTDSGGGGLDAPVSGPANKKK